MSLAKVGNSLVRHAGSLAKSCGGGGTPDCTGCTWATEIDSSATLPVPSTASYRWEYEDPDAAFFSWKPGYPAALDPERRWVKISMEASAPPAAAGGSGFLRESQSTEYILYACAAGVAVDVTDQAVDWNTTTMDNPIDPMQPGLTFSYRHVYWGVDFDIGEFVKTTPDVYLGAEFSQVPVSSPPTTILNCNPLP